MNSCCPLPAFTADDLAYCFACNTEPLSQCGAGLGAASNFCNLVRSQLCSVNSSPLSDAVVNVVALSADKKMFWVYACANVAPMAEEQSGRNCTDKKLICKAMRSMDLSIVLPSIPGLEFSIPGLIKRASPQPATSNGLINLCKKAILWRSSHDALFVTRTEAGG